MAILEGFRVRNYGVLRDVALGRIGNLGGESLTSMTTVIGKNGVGKSILFDAFGFLADALKFDVETACYARSRGGFEKIRSQGITDLLALTCTIESMQKPNPFHIKLPLMQTSLDVLMSYLNT